MTGADTLSAGDRVHPIALTSALGSDVNLPAPSGVTHVQFRRFAGCPVCNLHLRSFVRRHDELTAAGIHEVVFFHSTAEDLRPHVIDLPFSVVPDPGKVMYRRFGVESTPRVMLDPRAWGIIVRGISRSLWLLLRGRTSPPALRPEGGRFGQPADFLLAPDGQVLASHYGEHLDDHWSVDDVLRLATQYPGLASPDRT